MNKDDLLARLSGIEWNDFECKQAKSDIPRSAYTTVSAFANTAGGWLIFGVADQDSGLEIVGVNQPDKVQNDFLSILRSAQKLNRVITASPEKFEIDGKHVLAFHIPESERHEKPIYLSGDPRQSHIRRGAGNERCTQRELERFLRDAAQEPGDSALVADVPVEDCFDLVTVKWYQSQFTGHNPGHPNISDPIEFLLNWNFVAERTSQMHPTRAGILLFGVGRYVRAVLARPILDYQRIDTPLDQWSAEQRWHDRQIFEENIFQTWQGLIARYTRIAEHPFSLDPATLRRNDDPPDYVAFREAAINLLIHQDYGDHGRKASIRLFSDRTIFSNPGDAFATDAELLDPTEKDVRNPSIVNAFRRIGLSDQAGTGIRAIFRNWHALGRFPPQIRNDKARKEFELILTNKSLSTDMVQQFKKKIGANLTPEQTDTLTLALSMPAGERVSLTDIRGLGLSTMQQAKQIANHLVRQQLLQPVSETIFEVREELRERFDQQFEDLTPQVVRLLMNMSGKMTRQELLESVKLGDRMHFTKNYLRPALEAGLLEMTIPDKPKSKNQRYRLTELGQAVLEKDKT